MPVPIGKPKKECIFSGTVFYPDLHEMQTLHGDDIRDAFSVEQSIVLIEFTPPKPPKSSADPYRLLKADLAATNYEYPGTYTLWLYKDKRVYGSWKYSPDAKQDGGWSNPEKVPWKDMTVEGEFKQHNGILVIRAYLLEERVRKLGLIIEATKQ